MCVALGNYYWTRYSDSYRAMSANRKRSYDAAFKLAAVEDAEDNKQLLQESLGWMNVE